MNKGVLFVLSGPSGVGKGTVKAQLFEEFEKCLVFSVSATTRKPREGEVDGREYFFIDRDSFERKIRENAFLEHAEFAGNLYGTPREAVNAQLLAGRDVLLEIDEFQKTGFLYKLLFFAEDQSCVVLVYWSAILICKVEYLTYLKLIEAL